MAKKVMSVEQWQEFEIAIQRALPKDIDPDLAQKWIENKAGLPQVLRNALIVNADKQAVQWPVWKTLKLGTGLNTAANFRAALQRGGNRIGDWANDILGRPAFKAAVKETEVDLVKVTVAELGFKDGATRRDIYQRAKELGLDLCPAEVGPQLRLQYQDQPLGERLIIAMEPISFSDGFMSVFSVEHNGYGRWLRGEYGRLGSFWDAGRWFVFVRSK